MTSIELINPADETVIRTVEHVSLEQVDEAVVRAAAVQKAWASLAPAERASALRRFASTVEGAIEELAPVSYTHLTLPTNREV